MFYGTIPLNGTCMTPSGVGCRPSFHPPARGPDIYLAQSTENALNNPMPIWEATHAGTCYPRTPQAILKFFKNALDASPQNSSAPEDDPLPPAPLAWIVPHIDFRVDLSTYATVYRQMAQLKTFPETVYILGVGHRCPHDFSLCPGAFSTPLGRVDSATEVIEEIAQPFPHPLDRSPESFVGEHSLEFVVIWLQALRDLHFPGAMFRVVPVLLGGLPESVIASKPPSKRSTFHRFGSLLMDSFRRRDSTSMLIASIDGCHVGPRFDHPFPADERVQKAVWEWESHLWDLCQSSSLPPFYEHLGAVRNGFYFDGVGVLTLLLQQHPLEARILARKLWHQDHDHSFVTFSAGYLTTP
jgi:MEMO1 family protein